MEFGVLEQTLGHVNHLNVFIVSAKPQFWANFDIWAVLYRSPNLISIGLFCRPLYRPKTSFGLWNFVHVSPVRGNLRKLNTSAQLQTFPYPMASKSFLYSNAFKAKWGAQYLTFKSVTNKQTDKQTNIKTQRFWPPRRRMKSEPHQTWCMVIEDLEHVLAPWELFGPDVSFAARSAENFGETRPPQLKTPTTPSPLEQIHPNLNN